MPIAWQFGRRVRQSSGPMPTRSATPERKPSSRMSACATRRLNAARPSSSSRPIDAERLLQFLRFDSVGNSDPKIAAADAIEATDDYSAERASMSGVGRCLEMRGSRLANGLSPRDSFAERAFFNGRCWRKAAIHQTVAIERSKTIRTCGYQQSVEIQAVA